MTGKLVAVGVPVVARVSVWSRGTVCAVCYGYAVFRRWLIVGLVGWFCVVVAVVGVVVVAVGVGGGGWFVCDSRGSARFGWCW